MAWPHVADESNLPTPALVLWQDTIAQNIDAMLAMVGGDPARLRPHVKTHKLEPLVRLQIGRGITCFKAATIAEAEMTADAGASDVLLAYPAVGPTVHRLLSLARKHPATRFSTLVDHPQSLTALEAAAHASGLRIGAWLDIDCGQHRTGIAPGPAATALHGSLAASSALEYRGLHVYDGHIHIADPIARRNAFDAAMKPFLEWRQQLIDHGLPIPSTVAGGSPTFPFHAEAGDGRQCSPGTTILWDAGYGGKFPDLPFLPAAVLVTRVVSKPTPGRFTIDLGHKAVAADPAPPRATILECPDATFPSHSEEHLVVETPDADSFSIGQVLHAIPMHICPTVALHSEAVVVNGNGTIVATWPIAARARRLAV